MDKEVLKAVRLTAEQHAEYLISPLKMNWKGERERFVVSFIEDFTDNYSKLYGKVA